MDKDLNSFLQKYLDVDDIDKLSDEMDIEDDLGISGDDGDELFHDFCKTFNINLNDITAADYFSSEFSFFKFRNSKRKKLTIEMLKRAIIEGRF